MPLHSEANSMPTLCCLSDCCEDNANHVVHWMHTTGRGQNNEQSRRSACTISNQLLTLKVGKYFPRYGTNANWIVILWAMVPNIPLLAPRVFSAILEALVKIVERKSNALCL